MRHGHKDELTNDGNSDLTFDPKKESSNALEYLRKESLDIFSRLHSIAEDAIFVDQVHQAYPTIPLLPNLRCGSWYSNPKISATTSMLASTPGSQTTDIPAYFKSTDGHFSNWSFNLRRANLHLLPLIAGNNGMVLVDSTRAGKRIPDALSKTVPIWCSVINRAIILRYPETPAADWDLALYTPPGIVSIQEHNQIEQRLDAWADALNKSSFTLPKLRHPLRPMWITPATTTFPTLAVDDPSFLPIICVSASKQVTSGMERRAVGFSYIQGSGDDHELWSMGLTPSLFWRHKDELLAATRSQLPRIISSLVTKDHFLANPTAPNPIAKVGGRILICALSDLIETKSSHDQTNATDTAYILLTSGINDLGAVLPNTLPVLRMQVPEGKKGQIHFLQEILPRSMSYAKTQLSGGKRLCVACDTGKDASVGVALSALQKFFDDGGYFIETDATRVSPDKKSIRTRLEWIISSRPLANPSRTTLKRVNEFLLTPESFRISST